MPSTDEEWPGFGPDLGGPIDQDIGRVERTEVAASFARCFSTPDGRRVFAHLRAIAFGRTFGPEVSEAMLRHVEGQRQLLARIASLVRRGNDATSQSQ